MNTKKPDSEYTAADVFNETLKEQRSCLPPRKVRSKPSLPKNKDDAFYSYIRLGYKTSWMNFKKCAKDTQKKYILDMMERYPGIGNKEFMRLFNVSKGSIYNITSKLGIKFPPNGGKTQSAKENIKRFLLEVCKEKDDDVSEKSDICINSMTFTCSAEEITKIMKKYGFSGIVNVTIEKV